MGTEVQDLIDEFREEMGETDTDNSHFTDSEIIRWINDAQNRLCWKTDLLVKRIVADSTEGQNQYSLPPNFKTLLRVRYDHEVLEPTTRGTLDFNDSQWEKNNDGTPDRYYVEGDYLYFDKSPANTDKQIQMICVVFPDRITEATDYLETPIPLDVYVLSYTLHRGYKVARRYDLSKDSKETFKDGLAMARTLANDRNRALRETMRDVSLDFPTSISATSNVLISPDTDWG